MKQAFIILSGLFVLSVSYWTFYLFSTKNLEFVFTDWFQIYISAVYFYYLLLGIILSISITLMIFGLGTSYNKMKIGVILIVSGILSFVSIYIIGIKQMGNTSGGWID